LSQNQKEKEKECIQNQEALVTKDLGIIRSLIMDKVDNKIKNPL
jgi:hypothetical protein